MRAWCSCRIGQQPPTWRYPAVFGERAAPFAAQHRKASTKRTNLTTTEQNPERGVPVMQPLTAQSIGRRLWISYQFTNKRLIVSNT